MRKYLLSFPVRYQIIFVIGMTVILAFLIANICGLFFDMHQLKENNDLVSSIYQVMGTLYAILLTFTLLEIWQNFSEADSSVQKEAYTLLNLVHMIETSPHFDSINIRKMILQYLKAVTEQEWCHLKTLTNDTINIQEKNSSLPVKIIRLIQAMHPTNEREIVIFNQSLNLLSQWLDSRRARLLLARGNSARALWPLLFTGALVLFTIHGLFVAKTLAIWTILLLGISLVIGITFYLIYTLDSPFAGAPCVDREPFILAINILEGEGK